MSGTRRSALGVLAALSFLGVLSIALRSTAQSASESASLLPEIIPQTGHSAKILALTSSPDGRWLASGSWDSTVKVWEVATGRELRTLRGHGGPVLAVAVSADGRWLASGSHDRIVKVWEVETGRDVRTLSGHTNQVLAVAISPDGRWVASGGYDRTMRLWEVATGREVSTLPGHNAPVWTVAFSPDGRRLASSGGDNAVKLWEIATGRELHALTGAARTVGFSSDGRWLAAARLNGTLTRWETASGQESHSFRFAARPISRQDPVAFGPDGKRLAFGHGVVKVTVWDVANGQEVIAFKPPGEVGALALGPDGGWLVSSGHRGDTSVRLWETSTGRPPRTLGGDATVPGLLALSPDGRWLATASEHDPVVGPRKDYTVRLWDAATGQQVDTLRDHRGPVSSIAFAPDGALVGVGKRGQNHQSLGSDRCLQRGPGLEGEEKRRGPMNARGLAQLAYEKGMCVMAAAQGYQAALEATRLGHGLLTYALVEEGLKTRAADVAPQDHRVMMREWLDYATRRVPQLQSEIMKEEAGRGRAIAVVDREESIQEWDKRSLQHPRVFYRREPDDQELVIVTTGSMRRR